MIAAVLLLTSGSAHASFLCGLNQVEVESLLDEYGLSASFQEVSPFISAPFDCGTYGDLCAEVGPANAETFVCDRWDQMRAGDTMNEIRAEVDADLDALTDAWFAERFPSGVGHSHPYWGASPPPSGCEPVVKDTREIGGGAGYRIRGKSYYVMSFVYNKIGSNTRTFYREGSSSWSPVAEDVSVDADFKRNAGTYHVVCDSADAEDTDGKVGVYRDRIFANPYKYISASHQCDGGCLMSVSTCRTAAWSDPGCY